MQSTTAAVFRALVMLACLVAIPLAALVGKSLPDLVRPLLRGQRPWQSASAQESAGEAPPFVPGGTTQMPQVTLGDPIGLEAPQSQPWSRPASPDSAVVAAGHEVPALGASTLQAATWPQRISPSVPPQASSTDDRFVQIQDRLRQLGATYYVLESWGNQAQLYRFYCKVAVGGNPDYAHYFEATDSDSLRAMDQVLRKVETWRAARIAETRQWDAQQATHYPPAANEPPQQVR